MLDAAADAARALGCPATGDSDGAVAEATLSLVGFAVLQPVCAPSMSADTALGSQAGRLVFMRR